MDLRHHCHSNIIGAQSLLRLQRAIELAAVMVTSVPSGSHPPPGQQRTREGGAWEGAAEATPPTPPEAAEEGRGARKQ